METGQEAQMKIALCTTTIHVPHALELMRKCSDDVHFFVTGDEKTPMQAYEFMNGIANCHHGMTQEWMCASGIGANTLARRNIAFLEALKWGADVIYSWDNDNLPVNTDHFGKLEDIFADAFSGIMISRGDWFDPGSLLVPHTRHRGFPYARYQFSNMAQSVVNARVGVAAGFVLGDPDVDATTRIEHRPDIQSVGELGRNGVVVELRTHTVFNSQNTAVIRQLMPAWFMMPGVGRHDDIYASLIVQRVARERNLHVHFGQPFTYQQRNEHNLVADLRAEIDGMENVERLALLLDHMTLPGRSVIEDTYNIYLTMRACNFAPVRSIDAALLYLEDCESCV